MPEEFESNEPDTEVHIQTEGHRFCVFTGGLVPPIGSKLLVHKHLTSDGDFITVQVTSHEWQILEGPRLAVWVQTRVVAPETNG